MPTPHSKKQRGPLPHRPAGAVAKKKKSKATAKQPTQQKHKGATAAAGGRGKPVAMPLRRHAPSAADEGRRNAAASGLVAQIGAQGLEALLAGARAELAEAGLGRPRGGGARGGDAAAAGAAAATLHVESSGAAVTQQQSAAHAPPPAAAAAPPRAAPPDMGALLAGFGSL
jgi:hypothetical protein